jgi:hypothetical protein
MEVIREATGERLSFFLRRRARFSTAAPAVTAWCNGRSVLHAPVGRQGSAGHGAALAVLEWCSA